MISGILYVFCSYALIIAFGPGHISALASDPNPLHTAAIALVAPSIAIGVISTAFTDPGTAVRLLSTYGILGLVLMYLMANIALIVQWARFRRAGVRKNVSAWVVTPVIGVLVLAIPIWGDLRPDPGWPRSTTTTCPPGPSRATRLFHDHGQKEGSGVRYCT